MEKIVSTARTWSAVIGVHDVKGQVPVGLCRLLKAGVNKSEGSVESLPHQSRHHRPRDASYKETCVVKRLPKTRSGKILRGTMRKIADGERLYHACHQPGISRHG